jgi:hypothetical protein
MKLERTAGLLLALGMLLLAGCGGGPTTDDAGDSDSNAYMCTSCQVKFYTDRNVFAEFCPGCKSGNIAPVVAFVCPKDNQVSLATKTESVPCQKCNERVNQIKLPSAKELAAWGATKKTKAETCQN